MVPQYSVMVPSAALRLEKLPVTPFGPVYVPVSAPLANVPLNVYPLPDRLSVLVDRV
jgi:hypothetical protein